MPRMLHLMSGSRRLLGVLPDVIMMMIIITIAVFSIAPYLTDKGEHTAIYKNNRDINITENYT